MKKKIITRRNLSKKQKTGSNNLYSKIFIGLLIAFLLFQMFIKSVTIGNDNRFFIYIFLLPTFFGLIILGIYRINFLKNEYKKLKNLMEKTIFVFLYVIQGFFFSYLSIGLTTDIVWDNLNKKKANSSLNETINCRITKINSGTTRSEPNIYFTFQDNDENISIDRETYGQFYRSNPDTLELQLNIRKGIWNYYIVDDWKIISKR